MLLARLKLTGAFALLAFPLGAQSSGARTVSAELLQYPISDKAMHMLQRALQTSEAGDHEDAIRQLQKTLTKWPGTGAYGYSLLGVEYLKTGQLNEAVHVLEQAVTLLPHDASNHTNLGLALACKGQYELAEPELRRALDLDPHNMVARQLIHRVESAETAHK
jgi:Flp pilus assembly protein TadD